MTARDTISAAERKMIDDAIAAGRVQRIPTGKSAFSEELQYCADRKRVVLKDDATRRAISSKTSAAKPIAAYDGGIENPRSRAVFERRAKVRALMATLTQTAIAERLGVSRPTIIRDMDAIRKEMQNA